VLVGGAALVLVTLVCWLGPVVVRATLEDPRGQPKDAVTQFPARAFEPPSADEPLGRDGLGRCYLVRVLEGGRASLAVGLAATLVTVVIGTLVGALAGYYGGRLDETLMRVVDFLYGIPYMFLVILIMLMFEDTARGNPLPVFAALGLVQWLTMARIVRGSVLALREREFVLAARVLGASDRRILLTHVLPNVLGVVVVTATLTVPSVILLESFLSYLGLGLELSWGRLVAEAVGVVNPVRTYGWLLLWPSLLLAVTLLSLNFLGDGLRDALDPRTRA
jgi:oligopeptide transport system permease protein